MSKINVMLLQINTIIAELKGLEVQYKMVKVTK